ncbi:MAG TPA: hypothetical protein VHG28_24640 [Longimicrobiaceae bacterium]|nr:hypothetical protein [Longimicrobiaceae bacterium]
MDWIEVLFVLLFVGFSLLGRVAQRKPPPGQTLPSPRESDAPTPGLPAPTPNGAPAPAPSGGGGWSAGWGEWPGVDEEEGADEEVSVASDDRNAEVIHEAEAVSMEPVGASEETLRPLPVRAEESLEALQVDRAAEHERFHQRYLQEAPAPRHREALAGQLRSRGELRRAILLAEVLGPPRALREGETGR